MTCFAEREDDPFTKWSIYAYLIPILIILTYLPSFKYLAYAAYVGLAFLAVAMGVSKKPLNTCDMHTVFCKLLTGDLLVWH